MSKSIFILFCVFSGILFFQSCAKEKATQPPEIVCADSLTFVNDILPIFQTNCAVGQCHVSGSIYAPFDATNYDTLDFFINNGAMLNAIKHTGPIKMPRSNPSDPLITTSNQLPDSLITKIECWIEQGYPKL